MSQIDKTNPNSRKNKTNKWFHSQQSNYSTKTPLKSPNQNSRLTTTQISFQSDDQKLSSSKHKQNFAIPPIITQNPSLYHLYTRIHQQQQKLSHLSKPQYQQQSLNTIKQTIIQKMVEQSKQKLFHQKFSSNHSCQSNRLIKKDYTSLIGLTRQQRNSNTLKLFIMDQQNQDKLRQQAWLVQHYLRNQEKDKSILNIEYLTQRQLAHKHRRIASNLPQRSSTLFKYSNEQNYHQLQKTQYLKNDKIYTICIKHAKKNPAYLRLNNFSQIQYLQNENKKILTNINQLPQNQYQQQIYNTIMKLFLTQAHASDIHHTYFQYINQKSLDKISQLILTSIQNQPNSSIITKQSIKQLINNITKYKQKKVIHFEDFKQIINTLKQQYNYDLIKEINNNHNNYIYQKYISNQIDQFIQLNQQSITQILQNSKLETLTNRLYRINPNTIINNQYLPLTDLTQSIKNLGLLPHRITTAKFMYTCLWYQRRRQGFNRDEFIKIVIAVGLNMNCSLGGLRRYLASMRVQQVLASS